MCEVFDFTSGMGHTLGGMLVTALRSEGIEAAHVVVHPVYGGSRVCVYNAESRADTVIAIQSAIQGLYTIVEEWPVTALSGSDET